jgi:hypothetical protein
MKTVSKLIKILLLSFEKSVQITSGKKQTHQSILAGPLFVWFSSLFFCWSSNKKSASPQILSFHLQNKLVENEKVVQFGMNNYILLYAPTKMYRYKEKHCQKLCYTLRKNSVCSFSTQAFRRLLKMIACYHFYPANFTYWLMCNVHCALFRVR